MTEAPKRIWATINGQRSVLPGSERYLIGGWEGAPREHGHEYILAAENERLRKVIVELAVPLEALRMTGGTGLTNEIVAATDLARATLGDRHDQ